MTGDTSTYDRRSINVTAVLSCVAAVVGIFLLPVLLGLVAMSLGAAGLVQIVGDEDEKGSGWAWAGILIGLLTVVLGVIGWIVNDGWAWTLFQLY